MQLPEDACPYFNINGNRCDAVALGAKPQKVRLSHELIRECLIPNIPLCGGVIDETGREIVPDLSGMQTCGRVATKQIIRKRNGQSLR